MDFFAVFLTLFLLMDPFGNAPVFLAVLSKVEDSRKRLVVVRELLIALVLIVVFVFLGRSFMQYLGLSGYALRIAGAIILFLTALRMVFPTTTEQDWGNKEPLLVPLAVPLIAGPSLLAVLIVFSQTYAAQTGLLLMAAMLSWAITFLVLVSATYLNRFLSRDGLDAIGRLMGMILIALSIQLLLDGVVEFWRTAL